MSKNISLDEIKEFWPDKAPDINIVQKYVKKYENEKIVIKYGGNVLIDRNVFNNFISDINVLNKLGLSIIVVHGGGPRIKRELDKKKIVSKFINGLRVTDKNIIDTVEEVLIDFNKDIASSLKKLGSQTAKLISEIKPFDLENLIKWKVVQGGMIPKIENCVDAVQNGVRGVVILDGRKPHSILHEIFSDQGSGTLIRE